MKLAKKFVEKNNIEVVVLLNIKTFLNLNRYWYRKRQIKGSIYFPMYMLNLKGQGQRQVALEVSQGEKSQWGKEYIIQ